LVRGIKLKYNISMTANNTAFTKHVAGAVAVAISQS